jgi:thiamine pyrophosphokinase
MMTLAIIANGEEPSSPHERAAIAACQGCICCDRLPPKGAPKLLQVVGDMDSLVSDLPADLVTNLREDQETNDLTKAIRWAQAHFPKAQLVFFAVTGKREDHTLANLALIYELLPQATIWTQTGQFKLLPPGTTTIDVQPDAPISFLSFRPQHLTARPVVWPVESLLLQSLWQATLNKTLASTLTLVTEAPLYVYQPGATI